MAKKKTKNKKTSQRWTKYKLSGNKIEKGKTCPKCGPAMFLGIHKDRLYCGSCHYTEFVKK